MTTATSNQSISGITSSNGKIGVGTTSPKEKLHVIGSLMIAGSEAGNETGEEGIKLFHTIIQRLMPLEMLVDAYFLKKIAVIIMDFR